MPPDKAASLANDLECAIATLRVIVDVLATAYTDSDTRDSNIKPHAMRGRME